MAVTANSVDASGSIERVDRGRFPI